MAKFIINYTFHGRGTETIEAESLEAAREMADKNLENDNFDPPVDNFDDIDATVREMHPVTRDGRELWTTYVLPSDKRGHASALAATPLFAAA